MTEDKVRQYYSQFIKWYKQEAKNDDVLRIFTPRKDTKVS